MRLRFVTFCLVLCALGCGRSEREERRVVFARGGVVVPAEMAGEGPLTVTVDNDAAPVEGHALGDDRIFYPVRWVRGETCSMEWASGEEWTLAAPMRPEPVTVKIVDLEKVQTGSVTAGGNPDASLAFSADSSHLALGTFGGYVRVFRALDGERVFEQRLPGAVVKRVAMSHDGRRVYAGEMSVDAFVRAFDVASGEELWRFRLADDIETSRPARPDDFFALYSYPQAYCMKALAGDLFVAGMHSWKVDGAPRHRSRMYRLDGASGEARWRFPADAPLARNIMWFDTDGSVVALMAHQWESVAPGDATPQNAVYLLDAATGALIASHTFEPLRPHFNTAPMWYGLAMSVRGELAVGLMDGRAAVFSTRDESGSRGLTLVRELDLATPVEVTGVPIYAGVGWAAAPGGDDLYLLSDGRLIVSGGALGGKSVRADHPGANTIFAVNAATGERHWQWKLTTTAQSLATVPGLLVAATQQTYAADDPLDYGLTVLAVEGPPPEDAVGRALPVNKPPVDRLIYRYATAGPVVAVAVSPDGSRIAAVECAARLPDEINTVGAYRLHLVH